MADAVARALAGERRLFAPIAWERLPRMVNAVAEDRWWADPTTAGRLLNDLAGACGAGAVTIPLLRDEAVTGLARRADADDALEALPDLDGVPEALATVGRLAAAGRLAVLALVPTPVALAPEGDRELAADGLCDLAAAALRAGAAAIVTAGPADDVNEPAARLARLADNFGRAVIALAEGAPARAWRVGGPGAVVVAGEPGDAGGPGLALTPGDVSDAWDLAALRAAGAHRAATA